IYVERVDATNSSGTLTYTTGISGTQGLEFLNPDGSVNAGDTQKIVVNTNSATLNINGAGGVDKFDIEASSFTKSLTIAGNLGTVPDHEEDVHNFDSVYIDLRKTSGVELNIANLLVSNPDGEGIVISASKGQDNITLVAGANHDVIEFSAGGENVAANPEIHVVDLGNLRLANNQSFTIDGVTITNISTDVFRATEIAQAIAQYATNGALDASMQDKFSVTGNFASLKGDWAGATVAASGSELSFTSTLNRNIRDLNLSFDGNGNSDVPADITATIKTSHGDVSASVASATLSLSTIGAVGKEYIAASGFGTAATPTTFLDYTVTKLEVANGSTSGSFTFSLPDAEGNAQSFTLTLTATAAATQDTTFTQADLLAILNGTATSGSKTGFFTTAGSTVVNANWTITNDNTSGPGFDTVNFAALGIKFVPNAGTNTNINANTDNLAKLGITGTIDLGGTTNDITLPAGVAANLSQGEPAAFSTVSLKANSTKYEDVASLTVDGQTYKLQIINKQATDFTIDADTFVKLIQMGSSDTASTTAYDYGKWNNTAWSGSATKVDDTGSGVYYKIVSADGKTEDVGVSFGALLTKGLGIKAELDGSFPLINGFKFGSADSTLWTDNHTVKLVTSQAFGNQTLSATITPNAAEPAKIATTTFEIANGETTNTVTITGAGITGSAAATQVYKLLTDGMMDASFFALAEGADPAATPAPVVSVNGAAYSASNANAYKELFALAAGLEYTSGAGTVGIGLDPGATAEQKAALKSGTITLTQTTGDAAPVSADATISASSPATNGEISVTFGALKAGQSYTFNDKTVVATKDLSAGDVARAFTLTSDDSFDGAVILGGFDTNGKIVESEVLYGFSGAGNNTLIIRGTTSQSITANADAKVTGTGTIGVDTLGISQATKQQGSDGSAPNADSYVTFSVANAGGASAATVIAANTGALDTITNFDVANDGLRLKMTNGSYYGDEQALSGNVNTGDSIYVDAAGNTLAASAANGIISFSAVNASGDAVADAAITLEQKLYVATNNIGNNKVAGFAHEGDFYVIATGANGNSTTDDIVVKIAGFGGIT
ncbi:MAG: hypothetical protein K2N54_06220, partial [Helicobacter sp.]|nr:hypothetical protein [Helicobacter sp.]